jgi:DNA-binding transcriptional LysR family regulator
VELLELRAFLAVVTEGSFSRAAARLQRTQPAISLAVRRLESELGQRLFDRTSNPGTLTAAGTVLRDYADRILRLSEEAESSVREIDDLQRGRVLIGANDASVPILLPLIVKFQEMYPQILVDIRRTHSRHLPIEVLHGNLDFGLMTFHATERRLRDVLLGDDELVAILSPAHPYAKRDKLTLAEWAREPIVFHSDPSPARERVVRYAEERKIALNVRVTVPSIDGIKLAVEMGIGISLLPRRSVMSEIRRKQLVAVPVPELRLPRQVRLVYRRGSQLSQAAQAFLDVASTYRAESALPARRVRA